MLSILIKRYALGFDDPSMVKFRIAIRFKFINQFKSYAKYEL